MIKSKATNERFLVGTVYGQHKEGIMYGEICVPRSSFGNIYCTGYGSGNRTYATTDYDSYLFARLREYILARTLNQEPAPVANNGYYHEANHDHSIIHTVYDPDGYFSGS